MKLVEKVRVGGHVRRRYDVPKTPYQRVLDSPQVPEEKKTKLRAWYTTSRTHGVRGLRSSTRPH